MTHLLNRHHDHLRWIAEYALLPAHLLAVGHWYGPAICVGCIALVAHAAVAAIHFRPVQTTVGA